MARSPSAASPAPGLPHERQDLLHSGRRQAGTVGRNENVTEHGSSLPDRIVKLEPAIAAASCSGSAPQAPSPGHAGSTLIWLNATAASDGMYRERNRAWPRACLERLGNTAGWLEAAEAGLEHQREHCGKTGDLCCGRSAEPPPSLAHIAAGLCCHFRRRICRFCTERGSRKASASRYAGDFHGRRRGN